MSRSNKMREVNIADAVPNIIYSADGSPVRKVCFSFEYEDVTAEQSITKSLLGYVVGIGRIESLHLSSNATYTDGNIQFEQPEHATQLLNQSGCSFAGAIVHFWKYGHIQSLPDKCLQQIFRYLDLNDLVSVAQVNERFKQNAKSIFPLKFGSFKISNQKNKLSDKWMNDIHRLENFLPVFGEFVVEIEFRQNVFDSSSINRVMELFAHHCSGELKKLRLTEFHLEDALASAIEPLLARLTSLELFRCEVSDRFINSLTRCRELKLLTISHTTGDFQSFPFTLPKLETIDFQDFTGLNQQQMEGFLIQNPQLKNVLLKSWGRLWPIFSAIGQYLPQVEKLLMAGGFIDQPTFSRNAFASLKNLTIGLNEHIEEMSISATLSALAATQAPLESLNLIHIPPGDQLIDAVSELKTIKTLRLIGADYSISRLQRIIDNLKELSCLTFDRCDTLNADGLVNIVKNAKKLQRLNLWTMSIEINNETCDALVNILKNRAANRHLEILTEKKNWPSNHKPTHEEFLTFSE